MYGLDNNIVNILCYIENIFQFLATYFFVDGWMADMYLSGFGLVEIELSEIGAQSWVSE